MAEKDQRAVDAELRDLRAKLEAAEAKVKDAEEREQARAKAEAGVRINKDEIAFAGDNGGWLFEVGPQNKNCGLDTCQVRACDESEAIRWYTQTRDFPVGSGKPVDPLSKKVGRIVSRCIDPRREALMRHKHRLGIIRSKLNSGSQLSESDQQILAKHEDEIFNTQVPKTYAPSVSNSNE